MSRSRQAAQLARHLTGATGAEVTLTHDTGACWTLAWTDGPTREEMRAHLDTALASPRHSELRDRKLDLARGLSQRAWAARAIASRRKGTLMDAVAAGAADHRALGVPLPRLGRQTADRTHECYALHRHLDTLLETTSHPQRADLPEDEPLIAELLAAGTSVHPATGRSVCSEYDMAASLLAAEQAPAADQPPTLTAVRDPQET
ncbi:MULTISPECIES: hypothetical protein [Streptomyces]|uniref:hypothetical protein n=1 Tax=Streptomyces TaxID=1883 RepID=UPI00096AFD28|nr:hypothetical protein [Streptomyces sp. FR-008]KAF0794912.1 hypothetical protein P405_17525 [Streptomyces sp. FR-008]